MTDPDDLVRCFGAMRAAAGSGVPGLATRLDRVDRLRALVASNGPVLADALCSDYGIRSRVQTLGAESVATLAQLRHTRRRLRRWMRPQRRWAGLGFALAGGRAGIEWQPLGVVGIMSPWNFPVALTFGPLGQALAAGNRAMCKVSELTPATAKVMHDAVAEWFTPTEVTIVTGDGSVGARFSALPFDHLFFTGSGAVGRKILAAAAHHLTPVTLELGGKSPVLVGPGADLSAAARTLMFGKTFNAGQYCVAPDRVFVPVGSVEEFLVACREAIDPAAETTAIIDEHHHDRLAGLVQDAVGKGARYVRLGYRQSGADRLVPPAALVGIDNSMRIAHEEVFGPLFTLHPYERCDEVIDEINAGPAPLAAYYFGPAGETSDRFVRETRSGGVVINDIILQVGLEHLPFGGVGQSGMGVYHGRAGFETFSHAKPVVRVRHPLTPHLTPPYPAITERLIRSGLRLQSEILIRKVQRPGG